MPQNTPNYSIPYPIGSDPANVSTDMGTIAGYIDTILKDNFAVNIVRVTTSTYTAADRDFIIADASVAMTVSFPAVPQEGDFIRIVNFGSATVTVTSSATLNGPGLIMPNKGMMSIYTDDAWWCLPLSSSPSDGPTTGWTRPNDWITTPTLVQGDEVIYGIAKVYENLNNVFSIIVSDDYSVDWGDGSPLELYISGETATHTYDWASVPSGSLTTKGFRQALVEIRPQDTFNLLGFDASTANGQNICRFAELKITSPYIINLDSNWGGSFTDTTSLIIKHPNQIDSFYVSDNSTMSLTENVEVDLPIATSLRYFVSYAYNIKNLTINSSPNLTNIQGMFADMPMQDSIAFISDTSGVTDFRYMFSDSFITKDNIPVLDTSSGTDFYGMFSWTSSLTEVPAWLDTSLATSVGNMFGGMPFLESIPALDMTNVTNADSFANNCGNLRSSDVFGFTVDHTYQNCSLSGNALNNIYTNLGTVSVSSVNVDSIEFWNTYYFIFHLAAPFPMYTSKSLVFSGFDLSNFNGPRYIYGNYSGADTVYGPISSFGWTSGDPLPSVMGVILSSPAITITGNPGIGDVAHDPSIATGKGWTVIT